LTLQDIYIHNAGLLMVNIELVNVEEAEKQEERRALAGGELRC
jgi:hypothetical protein